MTGKAEAHSPTQSWLAFAACLALCLYGYVSGWAAWVLLVLLLGLPFRWFCHWMYTGRLRRYRFLFGIYLAAGTVGAFEAWQYRKTPESLLKAVDLPLGPGEPDLFLEYDLPSVLYDLYPERSEVLFIRAFQMKLCQETPSAFQRYSICEQFRDTDLNTIREYFETALAKKSRTDENLYYHYVEILIRLNAPQSKIDAATAEWKRIFPLSERPDPREVFAQAAPSVPKP